MEINGSLKSIFALGIVLIIAVSVYAISGIKAESPECSNAFISIESACYDATGDALSNNQPTLEIKVLAHDADVNGFKVKAYGASGYAPFVIFKNARPSELTTLSLPYNRDTLGPADRIEIEPILNINREIKYCGLRHGYKHMGEPPLCEKI